MTNPQAAIRETCSVCSGSFEVQFRYQMEERDGGFAFYCTQRCLEAHQRGGNEGATCEACFKRFQLTMAAQLFYVKGRRAYACSMDCRSQVLREGAGARLGDLIANLPPSSEPTPMADSPASQSRGGSGYVIPEVELDAPPTKRATVQGIGQPAEPTGVVVPLVPTKVARVAAPAVPAATKTPRVIAVFNHKGGTGKTTTAVSIAAGLAMKGHRVLLVDTDAQGNVAVSLGAPCERSLYHVLVMGLRVEDAVKTVRPNLDLLPSNETLAAAELYLAGRQNRDRVLRDRLAAGSASYDYVVIDCSPSLSLMNQNALVFADSVLVPVACDYLSLVGVRQVIKTIKNVNSLLHHPVQIWGVLPTFFDARAKICHEAVGTLREHFDTRCLAPIRAAIKVKEAPSQGQTIFEYAAGASAADDYAAVVDLIVKSRAGIPLDAAAAPSKKAPREATASV